MHFHAGREPEPAPVTLCGRVLPWVERADHLGHVIHRSAKQDLDCNAARGSYIGTSNEILNMFAFGSAAQKLYAVQTYSCAWYGAMLWSLYSESADRAYRAWNTTIKMAHGLPRQTRTFYVDHYLCPLPSVRQLILRRYVQFVQSLMNSENPVIWKLTRLSVNNVGSVTGRNVAKMKEEFQLDPLEVNKKLFFVKKAELPEHGEENIELLDYLLYLRNSETEEDIISELNELIFNVVSV